ncbi:hypothetical protein XELAEV_18013970mg [Xenopus laevis]|uniref:START domain-containing protein n=1 Tax=Xenopus laevis TaxID=8355 RepID=A0A974DQK4_XENLA|nr:hypothetical protein XELAEV_18013970mg [Xenopus laevis]
MSRDSVQIPDDRDFQNFRSECYSDAGWTMTYSKSGVTVWIQILEEERALHKIRCKMECKEVSAEVLYDVLHDIEYRKKWDSNVIETFDIGKLTVNADIGYYACKLGKYPPRKDLVRAVSIQTGYLIQSGGPKSSTLIYLAQVDPRGSLPKWVVNKSSQFLAPKAMKKMYKACVKYPDWKKKHNPHHKPWLYPEQSNLPTISLADVTIQHADSLENIDESSATETKDDRGDASDEDSVN